MRHVYFFVLAVLLALPLDGCGTGSSSTAPAPHLLGTSPTVSSPVRTVPQRGGRTVGELQLARDPSLRVDPLRDTVVVLLEPETASSSGDDTATPGVDVIPFRLAATSPVAVSVDSESVGHVVIRDAQGRVRFREPSGSARVVTLEAGDHTLELHSKGGAESTVFMRPGTGVSALSMFALSDFPPQIVGVSTGVPAFVGDLSTGPVNEPVMVSSWNAFVERFGGIDAVRPTAAQVYQFFRLGGQVAFVVRAAPSANAGVPSLSSYDAALAAVCATPEFDLLLVPDAARAVSPPDPQLAAHAVARAEAASAFAILEVPAAVTTPEAAVAWWSSQPQLHSTSAAVYYGTLTAMMDASAAPASPSASPVPVTLGPGGTMAGFYAWNDASSGVWNAPVNSLPPNNITGAPALTLDQRSAFNLASITPVFMFQSAPFVGGARTANSWTSEAFTYVQQRRLCIYITRSVTQGIGWTVFMPNTALLWATTRSSISVFLTSLWNQGAFRGNTAADAFNVLCGLGSSMTSQDILNGVLIVQVLYAPQTGPWISFTTTQVQNETAATVQVQPSARKVAY